MAISKDYLPSDWPRRLPDAEFGGLQCGILILGTGIVMRRREFITLIGGVVAACAPFAPTNSDAQQSSRKIPRVGWLALGSQAAQENLEEYRRGMRELGYVEGRTVETKYLYADGQFDRLPELAAMLVAEKVDIIVTAGTPGCLAAKHATTDIPIVFAVSSDPIGTGVLTAPGAISRDCRSWPRPEREASRAAETAGTKYQRRRRAVGFVESGNGASGARNAPSRRAV
jgi:ABC transporter substrate binding protein